MAQPPAIGDIAPAWMLDARNPKAGKLVAHILDHLRTAAPDRDDLAQFLAFAAPLAAGSKSQLHQELWALWMAGGRRDGWFVEFGAADGVRLSNTWFLETAMGWDGIIAEPHPAQAALARQARRCHVSDKCVWSRSGETLAFRMVDGKDELSRLDAIDPGDGHEAKNRQAFALTEVETISLDDLLAAYDAPRRIDYLSIDTEGSEFDILAAFDFARWDVRAVTVEHNHTSMEGRLDALFADQGYRRMWPQLSRYDAWYVRDDGRA